MPEVLKPSRGIVTFESEGVEQPGSKFHSRVFHVPTPSSGLTIGRGYDMKMKTKAKIVADLTAAGVAPADAQKISGAAGLSGQAAKNFVAANGLSGFSISQETQVKLFEISYRDEEAEVKRISAKPDCVAKFGKADWDKAHPAIRDILVDLKFRGDYTPASRNLVQKLLVNNDLGSLKRVMAAPANWKGVPPDRFKRRNDFLAAAV
ncbi:MAG TPA: hypothetical protein VD887_13385 [Allosphingosinicella sp.]|nr:hypothetical protein [Allosphingosinicella sp.]HYG31193.1 hypothetical protein [Allosphingosinicella sp.]